MLGRGKGDDDLDAQAIRRTYRKLRYHRLVRPAVDVVSLASLRMLSRVLTGSHVSELFLVGHMRSGSSLLSAILTANDEINGYGEAKVIYRSQRDIATLKGKIALVQLLNRHAPTRRCRFVFDKTLHARHLPSTKVLTAPNARVIFLLREPEATLRSIVASLEWSLDGASRYLIRQYGFLGAIAEPLGSSGAGVVVHHRDLIAETEPVLDHLSRWLGLATPLKPVFDPGSQAGIVGSGDRSENIKAGKVLRNRKKHEVDISGAPLDEIQRQYHQAVETIETHIPSWRHAGS